MSKPRHEDLFSLAMNDLERLSKVWDRMAAGSTNTVSMSNLLTKMVNDLMSPRMRTPYSMESEGLEPLANLLKKMRLLKVGESSLHESIATLGIRLIQKKVDLQLTRETSPESPLQRLGFEHVMDVEQWIAIKRIARTTFGAKGAIITNVQDIILRKADVLIRLWTDVDGLVRNVEPDLGSIVKELGSNQPSRARRTNTPDEILYDMSFQSEALKFKELLAEAEEDRATTAKTNSQLIVENERLQASLAAALQDKVAMAEVTEITNVEKADLASSAEQKQDQIEWLNHECDRLYDILKSANDRERTLAEGKEALVSANASLESSLSRAKDDHAALSNSNKKLSAEVSKKVDELGCALEIMTDLKDQKDVWCHQCKTIMEEKAALEEQLADTKESLHRATSTITADNMHRLTAQNFQLGEQLKGANDIIDQINSTLRSCSSSISTVRQPSTIRRSPDTATDDLIDPNEDYGLRNGSPVEPYVMGDTDSDVSSTILTPGSSVDLDESWDVSVNAP